MILPDNQRDIYDYIRSFHIENRKTLSSKDALDLAKQELIDKYSDRLLPIEIGFIMRCLMIGEGIQGESPIERVKAAVLKRKQMKKQAKYTVIFEYTSTGIDDYDKQLEDDLDKQFRNTIGPEVPITLFMKGVGDGIGSVTIIKDDNRI